MMRPLLLRSFLGSLLLVFLVSCSAGGGTFPFFSSSPTPTPTATVTSTPTETSTPTPIPPTATPTITPTPTWVWQAAGENITCPILLYHHIADQTSPTLYYNSVADFTAQMTSLHDWGYTAIPISLLVKAITEGADLPAQPIVITFDDGDEDVYLNAFPLMKELGYPGVMYIVSHWLGGTGYMGVAEITEMVAAGWEVGDHSASHINLQNNPGLMYDEAALSRKALRNILGLPIDTFAYPFGAADTATMWKLSNDYRFTAAVGLSFPVDGQNYNQGLGNLFYLSRIEVPYDATIEQFAALLPWSETIP